MVRTRRILVMLAAVAVIVATLATVHVATASPAGASVPHGLAQDPPATGESTATEDPATEIPPTEAPPTATQPTVPPPTQSGPTQAPPTSTPPTEDPPTQGPAPTSGPVFPTPTEQSRVSITVLPGTGGPAAPASGIPPVALVLIATAFLAASIAIGGHRRHEGREGKARE